ncbi:MAG: DUF6498-containing protein [Planctomycetota bacterium]|nr:DUF6498-containing protein [Planctomycetota bacterium]
MNALPNAASQKPGAHFNLSLWALVIANMVPILGGIFWGWDLRLLLVLYWAENLVIGFYNILKMILAEARPALMRLFVIPFFMVHFGGFCAVHGFFIYIFVTMDFANGPASTMGTGSLLNEMPDWSGPFIFLGLLLNVVRSLWTFWGGSLLIPLVSLLISHGISFRQNFIGRQEYRHRHILLQMMAPYGRVFLLHLAIIAAVIPVIFLGSPLPLLFLLVIGKTAIDAWLHTLSHSENGWKVFLEKIRNRIPVANLVQQGLQQEQKGATSTAGPTKEND